MGQRLVVVGGDAAGMTAASVARRADPDLEVVVFEAGPWVSYAACGIPYHVAGDVPELDDLVVRTPEEFRSKQAIDVRTHHEVVAIDPDRREVEAYASVSGSTVRVGFDLLMVATGAEPIVPDWPGVELAHVHTARDLGDAAVLAAVAGGDGGGRRAAVVGGGYIGVEMAESFTRAGWRVTLIDRTPQVLGNLDPDMAAVVATAMERAGVDLRLGHDVVAIEPDRVVTDEGDVAADVVVLGVGIRPRTAVARHAGIATGVEGAIVVDDHQRTRVEGAYAAGDCCQSVQRVTGEPTWIALGTVANKQGRVAGLNLAGGDATFPGVLGTAITRFDDTEIGRTGLTELEAGDAGLDAVGTVVESTTRASYLPGAAPITVKLVHDRLTGRLLGGQVVGGPGAGKRIDTVATALWAGMAVAELVDVDLAYAPPFGPVWDPVSMAARRAARSTP
jgi:NADPH-dependent 2,4-dienoyl-CoA reductase/sulfur reductase-like enzyme